MVDGLPTLALIELDVLVSVDGLDEAGFADAIGKAEHGCAISRALAGGPEIRVRATRE
jgi:organic hydroperoxide reductase OsmC/OhrA